MLTKNYVELAKEKAEYYGYENIEMNELMSIILGEHIPELCQLPLKDIYQLSKAELLEIEGIGSGRAAKFLATIGFAKKLAATGNMQQEAVIKSPEDAYELFNYLKHENQEHFVVAALDVKNKVIGRKTLFTGSLNSSVVHPREVFQYALKKGCASIIVAHNHPSYISQPSSEDISATKRLAEVGKLTGIELLDHIIVGENCYSLKEWGHL